MRGRNPTIKDGHQGTLKALQVGGVVDPFLI